MYKNKCSAISSKSSFVLKLQVSVDDGELNFLELHFIKWPHFSFLLLQFCSFSFRKISPNRPQLVILCYPFKHLPRLFYRENYLTILCFTSINFQLFIPSFASFIITKKYTNLHTFTSKYFENWFVYNLSIVISRRYTKTAERKKLYVIKI